LKIRPTFQPCAGRTSANCIDAEPQRVVAGIPSVKVEIERPMADARFFVSADTEAIILEMAGE
jgi:hypothetical protein